jgi:hypothetical protein
MPSTLMEKLLSAALGVVILVGAALAVYAGFEHSAAQTAQITQLQADNEREAANAAAALQAASALSAALDAKTAAQAAAVKNHNATTDRLASAVAASPAAASVVVPESYWQAVYGSPDAK